MKLFRYVHLCVLLFYMSSSYLFSQDLEKVNIGDILTLNSKVLNEDRSIYVYLPDSYNESTFNYPVLYLLDAEYEFHHTTGTISFLSGTGKIPEVIVVGIVNTNRSRDLTPEAPNDKESKAFWGEIGGADKFRRFLKEELIPLIDNTYRTTNYRLIRGQSFGGLFGIYDFLLEDKIFNAYIITSPSVGWNENSLFKKLVQTDFNDKKYIKVYIGEAEFDWGGNMEIKKFSESMKEKIDNDKYFKYEFFMNEGHYSLVFGATQNGLKFIYNYWMPSDSIMNSSDLKSLQHHYVRLSSEFGYEIKVPMDQIIRLANNQLRKKKYESGISIAKLNIELYPDQPQSYWHTGDAYFLGGNFEEALEYFEQALLKAKALKIQDLEIYKSSITRAEEKLK